MRGEGTWKPPCEEDKRRRLTDVVFNLSKHTRDKDPQKAIQSRNILKTALRKTSGLDRLMSEPPIFYREEENTPRVIHLENGFEFLRDTKEFQALSSDPTAYIEQTLAPIRRGQKAGTGLPKGKKIRELAKKPYDVSRVKLFEADGRRFVVKRVDNKKVDYELQEYEIAKQASAAGIPTPHVVGYVKDRGNTYLFFEYLESTKSLLELEGKAYQFDGVEIKLHLSDFNLWKEVGDFPDDEVMLWNEAKSESQFSQLSHSLFQFVIRSFKNVLDCCTPDFKERLKTGSPKIDLDSFVRDQVKGQLQHMFEVLKGSDFYGTAVYRVKEYLGIDLRSMDISKFTENKESFDLFVNEVKSALAAKARAVQPQGEGSKVISYQDFLNSEIERSVEENQMLQDYLKRRYTPLLEKRALQVSISMPFERFKADVDEQCRVAGIKHKDFNLRNILVVMDGKTGWPKRDEAGEAQFYVIDWEQK